MRRGRFDKRGILALDPQAFGLDFMTTPQSAPPFGLVGDTAVVSIHGPLTQHDEWWCWGCDNYDAVKVRVGAALESGATRVLLHIDSPGGDATGNLELARWIRDAGAAAGKSIVAFTDGSATSAAYAIAAAADGGIFLSPSARIGSIGTIMVAVDVTAADAQYGLKYTVIASGAHKADGHPHVAITNEATAEMRSQIDVYASMFFAHVAEMRPSKLDVDAIKSLEARIFIGQTAVEMGLAEGVKTFDALLTTLASGGDGNELARAPEGKKKMGMKECLAELKEMAEGDGEEADKAKKALKALGEGDGEETESEDGDKETENSDEEEEETPDSKKGKEGENATTPTGVEALVGTLAASIQALNDKVDGLVGTSQVNERQALINANPKLAPELKSAILKQNKAGQFVTPMSTVRAICKAALPPKKTIATATAAAGAKPTPTTGQGGNIIGGATRASAEAEQLDEAFGLKPKKSGVELKDGKMTFRMLTPEQARERAKKLNTPAMPASKEVGK